MLQTILLIVSFIFTACSDHGNGSSGANEKAPGVFGSASTGTAESDSLITGKAELAEIYSRAMEAYMAAVKTFNHTDFDTLFFGKQFDFPDMVLPETISGTRIRVLNQEEIDQYKTMYGERSPYINLIRFFEENKADFIFVTFYPEFNHQYDFYISFLYDSEKREFELNKSQLEVLMRNKEGKADHYAVYEDGKYVGDKPIK